MPSGVPRPDVRGMRDWSTLRGVDPIVEAAGFDLEGRHVTAAGRRSVVRVVVDSDAGVDLDAIARSAGRCRTLLDDDPAADLIDGAYQLEVTSPGVDRPLTEPRHWRRAIGRWSRSKSAASGHRPRTLGGHGGRRCSTSTAATRAVHVVGELGPGRVQVEFNRGGGSDARTAQTGEG